MYLIFFICSSVDGCLGCFRVLAVENSVAVNMGGMYFFLFFDNDFIWVYAQD